MNLIKDFNCTYDNSVGINREITEKLNLRFPDAYLNCDSMVILSKALKDHEKAFFCEMPFCHTVEAEAMGGIIKYGDGNTGPRVKEYICSSLEEILELPNIDFSKGRIHEVLLACEKLRKQGEQVVLEISGPFTILNCLVDTKFIFRGMRKNPELVQKIFNKIARELINYIQEAEKYGVEFISYADSAGSVSIIGPKMAEQIVEMFTYDFLKKLEKVTSEKTMVLLCPKTALALIGTEKAVFTDIALDEKIYYSEACLEMKGKAKFSGQMCIKNIGYILENKRFKKVELL